MEALVAREGQLPTEQAMLVVGLAKSSHLMFAGTDNFLVARDFAAQVSDDEKLALVRCLFAVAIAEGTISIAEEREIQQVARELRIDPQAMIALRLEHRQYLPGLSDRPAPS